MLLVKTTACCVKFKCFASAVLQKLLLVALSQISKKVTRKSNNDEKKGAYGTHFNVK